MLLTAQVDIERTLADVSHYLLTPEEVDFDRVLALIGRAIGARGLYLVLLPSDDVLLQGADGREADILVASWYREDADAINRGRYDELPWMRSLWSAQPDQGVADAVFAPSALPIPFFSREDRLLGYLGVVCDTPSCRGVAAESRLVVFLRDFLVTYLNRMEAERALGESEARWRGLVDHHPEPILITLEGEIVFVNRAGLEALGLPDLEGARSYSMRDFVSPGQYELLEGRWERLLRGGAAEKIAYDFVRPDGKKRVVEAISTPVSYGGRHAVQTILRDITERQEQEDRYHAFMQTISEAVWGIDLDHPVGVHTFPSFQVDHLMTYGFLSECNDTFARLWGKAHAEELIGSRLSFLMSTLGRSLLEAFVDGGYQLRNKNIGITQADGSTRQFVVNALGRVEGGRLVRIWGSCSETTHWADERHVLRLLERQREGIGRDLHDGLGQMLTSVRLLSSTLAAQYQEGDDRVHLARKVARFAGEAAVQMRYFYRGLMPPHLEQRSLANALSDLAFDTDSMPGISCTFLHNADAEAYAPEIKLHLYRIAQEATNNALKHAKARAIQIRLKRQGGEILLQVRDDGVGFDTSRNKGMTLGLNSMSQRARSMNATLHIGSVPGKGTTVTCVLQDPLDASV